MQDRIPTHLRSTIGIRAACAGRFQSCGSGRTIGIVQPSPKRLKPRNKRRKLDSSTNRSNNMGRNLLTLLLGVSCMNINLFTVASLFVLEFLGCAAPNWPPHADEARSHFSTHYLAIERLAALSQEHELWSVRQSSVDALPVVGYRDPYERENRLSPEVAGEFEKLFLESKASGVTRVDSIAFLSFGVEVIDSIRWFYSYILPEAGAELPSSCDSVDRFSHCGRCLVALEHGWHFRYVWYPPDHQEAERLCNSG